MSGESDWKHYFDRVGNNPQFWRVWGDSLLVASDVLRRSYRDAVSTVFRDDPPREEIRILGPSLLLLGQGIECYLKAILLKRDHKLAVNGKFKGTGVRDHNLVALAQLIGLKINDEEREVLERLSHYVKALGRCPIPTRYEEIVPRKWKNGAFGPPSLWQPSPDDGISISLVQKLKKLLEE